MSSVARVYVCIDCGHRSKRIGEAKASQTVLDSLLGVGFGVSMSRYVDPEPCGPPPDDPDAGMLSQDQVERWRNQGFVLVDGLLPTEMVKRLTAAVDGHYPAAGSEASERITDFGSGSAAVGPVVFPSRIDAFNQVTLAPQLLATVAQLLGVAVGGLRLTQSDLWPKYGRTGRSGGQRDNQDQRIHVDYPNHSLVHPAPWDRPEAVEAILYLSDHAECGGSTAVVPRSGPDDPAYPWPITASPGIGALRWINDKASAEEALATEHPEIARWRTQLYERERYTRFRVGTVLLYRHDTWHRGTPMVPGSRRLAQNLTFRRAECEWISTLHPGWSWAMYRPGQPMERLVAEASVDQRTVLGFPAPGSSYWVPETVAAVGARYGPLGMDMAPYERALATN